MRLSKYHRRPEGPGLLFSEDATCGALRVEVLGGEGSVLLDGRAATLMVMDGSGSAWGEELYVEDLLYLPADTRGTLDYKLTGRALFIRYAPTGEEPEAIRGHVVVRMGAALGYVRTQYKGAAHGWGGPLAGFNPQGIVYTDKLWGVSRDVLAQELIMPPAHVVPIHQHGQLGRDPDGSDFWQVYYVWEGSAEVQMGRSAREVEKLQIRAESVLVYPNGVAHNVIAGENGCRYLFFERRRAGGSMHLYLDEEKDYERKLTLRANMSLEEFLRTERVREGL